MKMGRLIVFGRFPPPIDGQSMLTKRFVTLLEKDFEISEINSMIPADGSALSKIKNYIRAGMELGRRASADRDATIIWQSISPRPPGHFRDVLTVLPHMRKNRTFAVVHWGKFDTVFHSPVTKWTATALGKTLACIVFNTEALSNLCAEWLPDNQRAVMVNTLDPETFCTENEVAEKRDRAKSEHFRILYLSNMIKEKGYLDVLEAAALLKEKGRDIAVDFVGSWSSQGDRIEFEDIVSREGLEDVVEHHGPVSDRRVVKQFHLDADVFVLPSYHFAEAQPLSIIEALNAGTPVIATRHGGIPEMVTDGDQAIFVQRSSPEAICDAVITMSDRALWTAMSLRSRKLFLEKYHPDVVRRQWIELLSSADSREDAGTNE